MRTWDTKNAPCRLCGGDEDRLSHLGSCSVLQPLFEQFDQTVTPQLIYLGLTSNLTPLTGLYSALFIVLWKFIMISFTKVVTDNAPFQDS